MGMRSHHKWREEFRLGHVHTVNEGWIFDWDAVSPSSHHKWRQEFRLRYMPTVKGGGKVDFDTCSPGMEGEILIGTRAHCGWRVDFR